MGIVSNLVLFKIVWLASLIGAGTQRPWLGLLLLLGFLAWHFRGSKSRVADALLLLTAALTGLVVDTLFIQAGFLIYAEPMPWAQIAPFWILVMWMNFALTLNASMRWLQGRYIVSAMLGAIGGPLAYLAGIELGAAQWNAPPAAVMGSIGLTWAIAVPLLAATAARLNQKKEKKVPGLAL